MPTPQTPKPDLEDEIMDKIAEDTNVGFDPLGSMILAVVLVFLFAIAGLVFWAA